MKKFSKLAVALVTGFFLLQAGQALAGATTCPPLGTNTCDVVNLSPPESNFFSLNYGSSYSNKTMDAIYIYYNSSNVVTSIVLVSNTQFNISASNSLYINSDGVASIPPNWDYYVQGPGATPTAGTGYHMSPLGESYKNTGDLTKGLNITASDILLSNSVSMAIGNNNKDPNTALQKDFTLTYDLSSLGITKNEIYAVGWVGSVTGIGVEGVYGTVKNLGTVPEPVTMVLFGAGITALAGWRRIRRSSIQDTNS